MSSRLPISLSSTSTLIHEGSPKQYRLHTERKVLDENGKVRKWTYGHKDVRKQNKIVLLVGETGVGKTTVINTMVNYLLGVKFEDEIWYEITEEEARDQSESQTSEITMYEVFHVQSPISLTIIDTPGYGDTRGLDKDGDVLMERIQFEAYICNLQLRIQEMEQKKAEKLQIQEAMVQNKEKIEECKNFTIIFKKSVKIKVPIESTSWKNRKATTCTICEENCDEFSCWWVSDPSKCEVMKDGFCTVCTGKCHHSKHVKENKNYIIKNSTIKIDFDNLIKEYEKAEEKSKMFSGLNDRLDRDLQDIMDQKSILLFNAYRKIKHLSQIALKPDSALTLQHLDFFIPRVREAGKETWVRELEEMKRNSEAEEANKDALSYLQAGLKKLDLFFSGQ